ncbi:MAG: N-acetylmuramoyl-L-alanine amidase, partial [Oscillospiraceae bacterium]|nr:N-acetylmuramoyl-L-alanine amidase [Oscillospiraceae bacterium]
AVVEPGGTVYQLADWETRCWHSGGSGNSQYIGVEMTEPSELRYRSGTEFSYSGDARETAMDNYNTAVALFANLCFRFSLDPLTDIVSHAEGYRRGSASAHADPEHLWDGLSLGVTMDTFRQDVAHKMEGTYHERSAPPLRACTVDATVLNIRSGPGTEYAVVGTLEEGAALTVCSAAEAQTAQWGRTESGWVNLNYVS